MTDRPTREQVDAAYDLDNLKYEAVLDAYNVLRAEVGALRAQAERARARPLELRGVELDDYVTRVWQGRVGALVKAAKDVLEHDQGPEDIPAPLYTALLVALIPFGDKP